MKKLLFVILIVLASCTDDSCEDEKASVNAKYENLVKQINESTPVDQIQLNLVNLEWQQELSKLDC